MKHTCIDGRGGHVARKKHKMRERWWCERVDSEVGEL